MKIYFLSLPFFLTLGLEAATTLTIRSSNPDLNGDGTFGDDIIGDLAAGDFAGANSVITAGQMTTLLTGSPLSLAATNSITFAANTTWSGPFSLTLEASQINLGAAVEVSNSSASGLINIFGNLIFGSLNTSLASNTLSAGGQFTVQGSGSGLAIGSTYDLFDVSNFSSQFTVLNLPALDSGKSWDTTKLYTTGEIQVVPEPTSSYLILLSGVFLASKRRKPL